MPEEHKPDTLWSHVLHKVGLTEHIRRFRFGGFVGKLCIFGATIAVTLGAVALKLHNDWLLLTALVLIAGFGFFIVHKISDFAIKHPQLAMFEGAEIIQWEQIKLAQKGIPTPALTEPIPEPAINVLPAEAESVHKEPTS